MYLVEIQPCLIKKEPYDKTFHTLTMLMNIQIFSCTNLHITEFMDTQMKTITSQHFTFEDYIIVSYYYM